MACLAGGLLLGGCHAPVSGLMAPPAASEEPPVASTSQAPAPEPRTIDVETLGEGAAPGNARGPGGFVPRGRMKNFYAGARNRLWYYMNNYYWVSDTAPREDLWLKADVKEEFRDLKRWPDGSAAPAPEPKVTVEYWKVSPTGRTVRLDNHKDYLRLADGYSAGAITVEVTLTLGRLEVRDEKDRWGPPEEAYVLESRNYRGGGGVGADGARFVPLETEAVTVWGYRIPWDVHPQRLTRSNWKRMKLPSWRLIEKRPPPRTRAAVALSVVTPRAP